MLAALVPLQTFSRELLVVNFTLNQAAITARSCMSKAQPVPHCDGRPLPAWEALMRTKPLCAALSWMPIRRCYQAYR